MPLLPTDEEPMNYQDTVRFVMTDGNKRVVCIVSGEVLEDVTRSPGLDNRGRLRAFHAHRSAIEAIASNGLRRERPTAAANALLVYRSRGQSSNASAIGIKVASRTARLTNTLTS